MRDLGMYPPALTAFILNLGLETLAVRMERHCANAQRAAEFLAAHSAVEHVNYPGLASDPYHAIAQKYLPKGCSGVISFSVRGGRDAAVRFMDSLQLCNNVVHVADICTCVLHPRVLHAPPADGRAARRRGITPGMIRLSVGLEHIDDILADLEKGFAAM